MVQSLISQLWIFVKCLNIVHFSQSPLCRSIGPLCSCHPGSLSSSLIEPHYSTHVCPASCCIRERRRPGEVSHTVLRLSADPGFPRSHSPPLCCIQVLSLSGFLGEMGASLVTIPFSRHPAREVLCPAQSCSPPPSLPSFSSFLLSHCVCLSGLIPLLPPW